MTEKTSTAKRWKGITPGTSLIEPRPVAIRANVAGVIVAEGDDLVVEDFTVTAGEVLVIQPRRILASGTSSAGAVTTTATGIRALYN
jgi:hypothetical protein